MEDEIYEKLLREAWSIMPEEAWKFIIQYEINENLGMNSVFWIKFNKELCSFELDNMPDATLDLIGNLLIDLKSKMRTVWNHSTLTLFNNKKFQIEFSYVDEEDTWPGLFMKGVSELTKEEAEEAYIPLDYWEERVRIKNSKS